MLNKKNGRKKKERKKVMLISYLPAQSTDVSSSTSYWELFYTGS
jgi:hypothetical protein